MARGFLKPYLNWTEVYIRSTNVNRTLASANAHFYGLFPIGTGYKIPDGINTDLLLPPFEGIQYEGKVLALFLESWECASIAHATSICSMR